MVRHNKPQAHADGPSARPLATLLRKAPRFARRATRRLRRRRIPRRNKEVPTAIGRQSPWGFGDAASSQSPWGFGDAASSRVKCAKCSRRPIARLTRLEAASPNISPVAYCPTSTGFA